MLDEDRDRDMEPEQPSRSRVSELFRSYIREVGDADEVDAGEYYERAGTAAPELRKRIRVIEDLRAIRDALCGDDDVPEPGPAEPEVKTLGRFQDLHLLGAGGLSRVFLAFDPELGRQVALKVFSAALRIEEDSRSWTLSEARTLARLTHPGIVRVFDIGVADGMDFLAMEFIDGPSLQDVLQELRRFDGARECADERVSEPAREMALSLRTVSSRCRLIAELAKALDYGHEAGVVHRDVKPGNVLLEAADRPKLIDFGLASFTAAESLTHVTQRLVGTAPYIAPEQARSGRTGAERRSDIFSLGVVLYELLSLKNPFIRPTQGATLDAVAKARPARLRSLNPEVPEDLERICHHCLEPEPEDRYASMAAVAADLEAFLDHRSISVQPPSVAKLARLWVRRNRRSLRIGAVIAGGLLLAVLLATGVARRQDRHDYLSELRELETRIAVAEEEPTFDKLLERLIVLRHRGEALDSSWFNRRIGPPIDPATQRVVEGASRRLAAVIEQLASSKPEGAPDHAWEKTWIPHWRGVFEHDQQLLGSSSPLSGYHDRGLLSLAPAPPGVEQRFFRHESLSGTILHKLVPADPSKPLYRGYYRFEARDAATQALISESDFFLEQADPRRVLRCEPPDPSFVSGALFVGPGEGAIPWPESSPPLPLEAFLISPKPITWKQMIDVLGTEADEWRQSLRGMAASRIPDIELPRWLPDLMPLRAVASVGHELWNLVRGVPCPRLQLALAIHPDSPARVRHAVAEGYALALHARLPLAHEIRRAWYAHPDEFLFPELLPRSIRSDSTSAPLRIYRILAEWTCSTTIYREELRCRYEYGVKSEDPNRWTVGILGADAGYSITFRVATSVLPPESQRGN